MKSSHLHIKEKMALVTRDGLTRGRMILMNMVYMVHPSILAASSKSMGIPFINCTFKKMKKPWPKKLRYNDGKIASHPSHFVKNDILGNHNDLERKHHASSIHANQKFLNLKSIRANP